METKPLNAKYETFVKCYDLWIIITLTDLFVSAVWLIRSELWNICRIKPHGGPARAQQQRQAIKKS